ncbi:MAG: ABC transporter permease [Phycisphaerales bacterium]|nr:ABC transporter permease [Phycisphaerales bacterium]
MTRLILRRLLQLPPVLLVIYTLTLALAWGVPGNPLERGERRPPPEVEAAMRARYNLDSFWGFYFTYLDNASGLRWARDRVTGGGERATTLAGEGAVARRAGPLFDLGPSLQYEDWRVNEVLWATLPVSVTIGGAAMVIALVVGVGSGVVGAARPNSGLDLATLLLALVGISLPSFVTGTLLQTVFSVWLGWLPVAEWGTARALILPSVTLSLPFAAYIARLTRMGMIEALRSDYVRTARAKGVSARGVVFGHALKNAFLPVLSYLGPATAMAMTGSFVVERVFSVPGLGQHFVNAVLNKDLFMIIGVVLVFSTMLVVFNLAVDVLYRWADPRIE